MRIPMWMFLSLPLILACSGAQTVTTAQVTDASLDCATAALPVIDTCVMTCTTDKAACQKTCTDAVVKAALPVCTDAFAALGGPVVQNAINKAVRLAIEIYSFATQSVQMQQRAICPMPAPPPSRP